MLRIPYVPTPYPDELMASLLTRLVLHNGTGLWRSLLEASGYGRRTITQFIGPPMRDARIDRMLGVLGHSYPEMLQELTSLPFWLAFNNATGAEGRIRIDALDDKRTKLAQLDRKHVLPGAKYCPTCLVADIEAHGEPYVHRHHQLPVALVCALHATALRFACPSCKTTVLPFNRTLLKPPALRCLCGQDLSLPGAPLSAQQSAFQRLSRFAADSLSCNDAPWTSAQVLAVLRQRGSITREAFRRTACQLLTEVYGPAAHDSMTGVVLRCEGASLQLRLNIGSGVARLRAPEFCALLAATGLSFEEFRQTVAMTDVEATPMVKPPPRPFSLMQARLEFKRFESESPGRAAARLLSSSPQLFWLLRLRDIALMRAHGYAYPNSLPAIEADRAWVEHRLQQGVRLSRGSGALIRASVRDHTWLEATLNEQARNDAARPTRAEQVQRDRAVALSRGVFSLLRTQERPARIHAGTLARLVQLSMHQAQHTIAHTPALEALIAGVNAGKNRRLAFWAARSLIDGGHSPTPSEVLLRAGLNTTRVHRQFCIDALTCMATRRNRT